MEVPLSGKEPNRKHRDSCNEIKQEGGLGNHYYLQDDAHKRETAMTCDVCGGKGAVERRISRSYGHGAALLVIENVPIVHCQRCGESYVTARTLYEIERIKLHRRPLSRRRSIAVAAFP